MTAPLILGTNSIKDSGFDVDNSLRFDSASSDSLTRSTTAGTRTTWTFSTWFKRSKLGVLQSILEHDDSNYFRIRLTSGDVFEVFDSNGNNTWNWNPLLRDISAWYHIVLRGDSTDGTNGNRLRLYINGTLASANTVASISQNYTFSFNQGGTLQIGKRGSTDFFDGYLAETILIDGSALAPDQFGEFDSDSPTIWKPKNPSGLTFGSQGFYLDYKDSSALGNDVSGNNKDFTVNNLTAVDQSTDTCTNNFATLNPLLDVYNPAIFSNGNLTATGSGSGNARYAFSSFAVANGKWYYEVKVTVAGSNPYVGVIDAQSTLRRNSIYFVAAASGTNQSGYAVNMTGDIYHNNSNSYASNIGNTSTGDILGFAIDLDSAQRTCEIYRNGSSQRSFNLDEPTSGFYLLGASSTYNQSSAVADMNFGSPAYAISSGNQDGNGYGNFEYAVPSGYYSLNSKNLAEFG